MLWWAALAVAAGEPEPTDHTLIYYNARMALREGQSLEAVKLWLLRNALEDQTGEVSPHDGDFHSVTWAALGDMGICQDGHPPDDDGAGLWPIALHNWVVRNMSRRSTPKPRPFDAFEVGRQQRFVSIGDVLSAKELTSVRLFRGGCVRPRLALLNAGENVTAELSDRQVSARLLQHLLEQAGRTVDPTQIRGWAAIEARLFDIHLQLTSLAAREARMDSREQARRGRQIGLSKGSVEAMKEEAAVYTFDEDSEPARILRQSVDWPVSEWMALSPDRRLFLFDHARRHGGDADTLDAVSLGVIDRLVAEGEGEEVEKWIAYRVSADDPSSQRLVWADERGQRLLALDATTGFQERSVIALHRGVHQLQSGDLPGALRSVAYALQNAHESRDAERVQSLARRWLSYIASQFEISHELLATLQELVPRRDYSVILEDLLWHAAFHADQGSFDRGVEAQIGSGALGRRIDLLGPLAAGDVGRFSMLIRSGLNESPSETLRFLDQMVQRLELEDAQVRTAHLPTLTHVRRLLLPLTEADGPSGRLSRRAGDLVIRTQAIMEGLGAVDPEASARDRARTLAPTAELFAGSVRVAPSDPLPWPFVTPEVAAPSVFMPLQLIPEEWRSDTGAVVFGWRIDG